MRISRFWGLLAVLLGLTLLSGCTNELQSLQIQNKTQQKRIAELTSQLQVKKLQIDQLKRQLQQTQKQTDTEVDALKQKIAVLKEDVEKKKELIKSMQQRLLSGGAQLPVELSTKLKDFAKNKDIVIFDVNRGMVKFKSDPLFDPGSAEVASDAKNFIKTLSEIMQSKEAQEFDLIVAGHTDSMPIGKPETKAKHPTNWHLSAHRAISVLQLMRNYGLAPERMSIRAFGQYRPIVESEPTHRGQPQNRRVEIYIVPKGA